MSIGRKPDKPYPDFPLFAHATGRWAKKIKGKLHYFGKWDDALGALKRYEAWVNHVPVVDELTVVKPKVKPPYPEFPLQPHANGQWCKKMKGTIRYFGPIADWQAALGRYLTERDELMAGKVPASRAQAKYTIEQICDRFEATKRLLCKTGRIKASSLQKYEWECRRLRKCFGDDKAVEDLTTKDFETLYVSMAEEMSVTTLGHSIQMIKMIFKHHAKETKSSVPNYGEVFRAPTKKEYRVDRISKGKKLFTPEQLMLLLVEATPVMKAMILLGVNCGYGNTDCGMLPREGAINFETGFIAFDRQKTAITRRCPLWPETIVALKEYEATRVKEKTPAGRHRFFLNREGNPFLTGEMDNDQITKTMNRLLKKVGLYRQQLGFYALRHTFQTIAEGSRDQKAVQYIMGHAPASRDMSAVYREEFSDDRLRYVTNHVRAWITGEEAGEAPTRFMAPEQLLKRLADGVEGVDSPSRHVA